MTLLLISKLYFVLWNFILSFCFSYTVLSLAGVEIAFTGNSSLAFSEGESGSFNVCVAVVGLPAGGLSCDQLVVIVTMNGTAGMYSSFC